MTFILALPIIATACLVLYLLYRRTDVGLILLLAAEAYHIAFGRNAVIIGGLHISPSDGVAILLFIAGAVRTMQALKVLTLDRLAVAGYVVLFAFSFIRGVASFGLTDTGNEARLFVGPLAALLYFATASTDAISLQRYTWSYLCFGVVLIGIIVASMAGLPVGIMTWDNADLAAINGRYLPATGAAALAVCGFLSLALLHYRRSNFITRLLPMLFIGSAAYLRHRTVWMMLLAGIAALFLVDRKLFRRILLFTSAAVVLVAAVVIYSANSQELAGESQFSEAASNSNTFLWRLHGWQELLFADEQNPFTIMVGKSVGSGYSHIDPTTYQAVNASPHNDYVATYLRVGIIGLTFMLLFLVRPLIKFWRLSKIQADCIYPSASAWAIVVLTTLVYGFAYGIEPHSYALLGIANAIMTQSSISWSYGEEENAFAVTSAIRSPEGYV